eukprot:m.184831 g.184831  ORF g.184831 m.184831 type:complete len:217 (-) comp15018_c0_seq11:2020-2670(-)
MVGACLNWVFGAKCQTMRTRYAFTRYNDCRPIYSLSTSRQVRVPLIMKVPWLQTPKRCNALVELVDLAPTIWELVGLDPPQGEDFDGVSLVPLLSGATVTVKDAAFSQYPRRVTDPAAPWRDNSIIHNNRSTFTHMGMSIRTEDWRLTQWALWNGTSLSPIWNKIVATELYDHRNSTLYPVNFELETVNVASVPGMQSIVSVLSSKLRSAFDHPEQ